MHNHRIIYTGSQVLVTAVYIVKSIVMKVNLRLGLSFCQNFSACRSAVLEDKFWRKTTQLNTHLNTHLNTQLNTQLNTHMNFNRQNNL